jgi:dihydropteroate synthase
VHCHLIAVEVGIEPGADQRVDADGVALDQHWLERLDTHAMQSRCAVEQNRVVLHNRSNPASVEVREQLGNAYIGSDYDDLIEEVRRELLVSVEVAKRAGVEESHIILDPGIGFGKKREHNLELINRLDEIRALGYPVLLGPSRKSFIGFTLDLPADQRIEGTAATIAVGIARGADIIRVHDVKEMSRVAKMTDAMVR